MDLQNNSATKVAALDERGVTLERDGKPTKFIPWGEDAEARAAAAAAQSTADSATRKANAAQNKANNAEAKAEAAKTAADAADGKATAAKTAADAAQTAAEAADGKATAAKTAADAAQTAAEAAAEAAGNAVQKISSEEQTAGYALAAEDNSWNIHGGYDGGVINLEGRSHAGTVATLSAVNDEGTLSLNGPFYSPGLSTGMGQRDLTIKGGVRDGIDHKGERVEGDKMQIHVDSNISDFLLAQRTSVDSTEATRSFGVFRIPLSGFVDNHRIEMRSAQIKNDQSDWARDRQTIIDWGEQKIILRRWKNTEGEYEERVLDLWSLALQLAEG